MPIWSWGSDIYGRLGQGTVDKNLSQPTEVEYFRHLPLKTVTCGSAHNVAIDKAGVCYTWGKCHYGQLGHGEEDRDEHVPRQVMGLNGVRVERVGAGDSHVLAITDGGVVFSWGLGYYGCLGHGDETSRYTPTKIQALSGTVISSVTAGACHSVAIDDGGRVLMWGRDHCGQLGQPSLTVPGLPKPIRANQRTPVPYGNLPADDAHVIMVSACNNHTLLLLQSGRLLSLGCNENGELGRLGDHTHSTDPAHLIINSSVFIGYSGEVEPITFVCAGWKHCAAITSTGCLYTWGHGAYGRLGRGHSRSDHTPGRVLNTGEPTNPVYTGVACGESHTLAIDTNHNVWACGSGHYGKLGLPLNETDRLQPIKRQSSQLSGILCGTNHSLAFQLE